MHKVYIIFHTKQMTMASEQDLDTLINRATVLFPRAMDSVEAVQLFRYFTRNGLGVEFSVESHYRMGTDERNIDAPPDLRGQRIYGRVQERENLEGDNFEFYHDTIEERIVYTGMKFQLVPGWDLSE